MQDLFEKALKFVKSLPTDHEDAKKIDNQTKLKFYAFYKQATEGPNKTKAPSKLKVVERYKWNEWKALEKMSKEEAMKKYVEALAKKVPNWQKGKL